MPLLKRSASLSQHVTTEKMKKISGVGRVASNQQHLTISNAARPALQRPQGDTEAQLRFPEVWRDRFSAAIRLTSTPEARSLTSL